MRTILTAFYTFLLKNILVINNGTVLAKIKSTIIIAFLASPIVLVQPIKEWLLNSATYFLLILGAIVLDWCIGSYVHFFKLKDFSLKKNVTGLVQKLFITTAGLILFEILKAMCKIHDVEIGNYTRLTIALIVLSYPLFSAFGNLSTVTNGVFPPIGWMNRIKKFQENADLKDLIPKTQTTGKDGN